MSCMGTAEECCFQGFGEWLCSNPILEIVALAAIITSVVYFSLVAYCFFKNTIL